MKQITNKGVGTFHVPCTARYSGPNQNSRHIPCAVLLESLQIFPSGRHNGVCLLLCPKRTAQRSVPATFVPSGRHNGVCLLLCPKRTAQRSVPATFVPSGRHNGVCLLHLSQADGTTERACYLTRFQFPALAEEIGVSNFAWPSCVRRDGNVNDGPVGKFGNLSGIVQVVIFPVGKAAVEYHIALRV